MVSRNNPVFIVDKGKGAPKLKKKKKKKHRSVTFENPTAGSACKSVPML